MAVWRCAVSVACAWLVAAGCSSDPVRPAPESPAALCGSTVDTAQVAATVGFRAQIRPMLDHSGCTGAGCHGGIIASSNYSLDTYEGLMAPGEEARAMGLCAVIPGAPDSSYLVWKVEGRSSIRGDRMPQGRPPLSAPDLALLRQWIAEGARNN